MLYDRRDFGLLRLAGTYPAPPHPHTLESHKHKKVPSGSDAGWDLFYFSRFSFVCFIHRNCEIHLYSLVYQADDRDLWWCYQIG